MKRFPSVLECLVLSGTLFSLVNGEASLIDNFVGEGCEEDSTLGYPGLILWLAIVIYVFAGLYILCEVYFVPSLCVLGNKLGLSEDVCGATLMAAGSSSPELFTALIGVFLFPDDNPGPSTNCASAVFNMCIIVGMSILCTSHALSLTYYAFFRDSLFFGLSALQLYLYYEIITPGTIYIWESLMLVLTYALYVTVMCFNDFCIRMIIRTIRMCGGHVPSSLIYSQMGVVSTHESMSEADILNAGQRGDKNEAIKLIQLADDSDSFPYDDVQLKRISDMEAVGRHLSQNMKISIPGNEDLHRKYSNNGIELGAVKLEDGTLDETKTEETSNDLSLDDQSSSNHGHRTESNLQLLRRIGRHWRGKCSRNVRNSDDESVGIPYMPQNDMSDGDLAAEDGTVAVKQSMDPNTQYKEGVSWMDYFHLIMIPFQIMFHTTMPALLDDSSFFRLISIFAMSICWLAALTFLAVDCAHKIGDCMHITADVTGLTLLAVGTSLPDCFSSILVAREGKGGMAVANALGSNVFDLCICVGFSFFLKSLMAGSTPMEVESGLGYEFFIIALFLILAVFVVMLYRSGLVLHNWHGYVLLCIYVVFIITFAILLDLPQTAG